MNIGESIQLYPPAGDFVYKESPRNMLVIAGGIGITPLLPIMEKALKESNRSISFMHCARSPAVQAFGKNILSFSAQYPDRFKSVSWYSDRADGSKHNRITKNDIENFVGSERNVDAYFVGPRPFMKDMKQFLGELGIPMNQTYYEFFGPASDI
jgi:nitric oxide dioxygenase